MKAVRWLLLALALPVLVPLALGAQAQPAPRKPPAPKTLSHHILRGRIVHVDPAKGTFEIRTVGHETVPCYVNSRSIIRRNGKPVTLAQVREGERARCICAEQSGERHYSLELLLAPLPKTDKTPKK